MKVTAIPAITQCFCTSKTYLSQTAVCNIINIAKQAAQVLTAVFHACCMPKAFFDSYIIVIITTDLFTFLQICRAHNFKKNTTIYTMLCAAESSG